MEARDATNRPGRYPLLALAPYAPPRPGTGSDATRLGAWEDSGTLGTPPSRHP